MSVCKIFVRHFERLANSWVLKIEITKLLSPKFNVSSTNSEQCKLCVNGPLYIDARLLWKQAIGSNCS